MKKGSKHKQESIEKIRIKRSKQIIPKEIYKIIGNKLRGIKRPKEICEKISKSKKGKSSMLKGIPRSPEVCKKIGDAQTREKNHWFGKSRTDIQKKSQSEFMKLHNPMKNPEIAKKFSKIQSISKKKLYKNKTNHPSYIDGRSFLPYCPKFDNKFRVEIRIRDGNVCQLCNKTQEQEGKQLAAHHIHYDKQNCYPDCICLCKSCNSKVNKKSLRKFYESLFMNNLNEKGLLFWSKYRNIETYLAKP